MRLERDTERGTETEPEKKRERVIDTTYAKLNSASRKPNEKYSKRGLSSKIQLNSDLSSLTCAH